MVLNALAIYGDTRIEYLKLEYHHIMPSMSEQQQQLRAGVSRVQSYSPPSKFSGGPIYKNYSSVIVN